MSEKLYCEVNGEHPFNWEVELKKPDSEIDWQRLYELSNSWVTCACGNQCAIIPRHDAQVFKPYNGRPKDKALAALGIMFMNDVRDENAEEALKTLARIERRSTALINEINSKK